MSGEPEREAGPGMGGEPEVEAGGGDVVRVAAAVIFRDGRILLAKRPPGGAFPNLWEFPGGKIEPGETPEVAVVRELAEELGVLVRPQARLGAAEHRYPDGLRVRLDFLLCGIEDGEPKALDGGELRWVTPREAVELPVLEADLPFLRDLANGRGTVTSTPHAPPVPTGIPSIRKVMFPGPAGDLEGLLQSRGGSPPAVGLVCHPHPFYGGSLHNKVVFRAASALHEAGLDVLRFNFRGVGESAGTYDGGRGEVDDARAAVEYLAESYPAAPMLLAGFSFGAGIALQVAVFDARVRAVIAISPIVSPEAFDPLATSPVPKLFIQGTDDDLCPIESLREAFEKVMAPRELVIVDRANHFFDGRMPNLHAAVLKYARERASADPAGVAAPG